MQNNFIFRYFIKFYKTFDNLIFLQFYKLFNIIFSILYKNKNILGKHLKAYI